MFKHSYTAFAVSRLWRLLGKYKESVIYNLFLSFFGLISSSLKHSIVRDIIVNRHPFDKATESSVLYSFINCILRFFMNIFNKVYDFVKKYSKDGICYGFVKAVLDRPYIKFVYICGAFFFAMMIVPHDAWNNIYAVGGAVLLAGLYIIGYLSGRTYGFDFKAVPVSLIAFVVATFGGIVMSPDKADGLRIGLFFLSSVLFTLIIWGSVSEETMLKRLVIIIVSALTFMCVYGLYQHIIGVEVDYLLTDLETNKGMPGRIFASFENPNNFAEAIILVVPFLYALFLGTDRKGAKLTYAGMFIICIAALAFTFSRSGYVAFMISTLVFVAIYDWRYLFPLMVIGLMCLPFLPQTVWNRILTIGSMEDTSNSYRIYLWTGVIKLVRYIGIGGIGIGPQAFSEWYPSFAHEFATKAPHSHMLYLELLVEIGIVGLGGYLAFLITSFKKGLSVVNKTSKSLRCIIIAAISGFCGISFTACAEYIWFYPRVMFVFFVVMGILLAAVRISKRHKKSQIAE